MSNLPLTALEAAALDHLKTTGPLPYRGHGGETMLALGTTYLAAKGLRRKGFIAAEFIWVKNGRAIASYDFRVL